MLHGGDHEGLLPGSYLDHARLSAISGKQESHAVRARLEVARGKRRPPSALAFAVNLDLRASRVGVQH